MTKTVELTRNEAKFVLDAVYYHVPRNGSELGDGILAKIKRAFSSGPVNSLLAAIYAEANFQHWLLAQSRLVGRPLRQEEADSFRRAKEHTGVSPWFPGQENVL
jgi:hypothetical protein